MNKIEKVFNSTLAVILTGLIAVMPCFTCTFMFHQPEMPEEINDFRKYDK